MQSSAVLSSGHLDLFSMEKSDISKNLFGQIQWEEILRSGVFLQHKDHQLLERSQANLGVILDNPQDATELSKMLIKIAENCTANLTVQQYAFTRMEEILGLANDFSDSDSDAYGSKHCHLFTSDGIHLVDGSFVRALSFSDIYLQKSASVSFACLLTKCEGNLTALIHWLLNKLSSTANGVWDMALPALAILVRGTTVRKSLVDAGIVTSVVAILKRLGANGNAQQIYELIFVLWTLTLGEVDTVAFLSAGSIPVLVDFLSAAPSRKITRMALAALRNLSTSECENVLNEMLTAGLLRLMETLSHSAFVKQAADLEIESDFKVLYEVLQRNHRELSTFERWASEVSSGALRWGILHTEKFWRENAKFIETDNFKHVKTLISLLKSSDANIVCVALYDLGEFTRFYPNGRVVVSRLGGKDLVMQMLGSENLEIQRHTLQCISKIMVTNWEYLR